jgi:hypothetical protein
LLDDLIAAVAARHGFRSSDYSVVWDGGSFDASRKAHTLLIQMKDGRHVAVEISDEAVGDPWRPLRPIEEAFGQLQRRAAPRGD